MRSPTGLAARGRSGEIDEDVAEDTDSDDLAVHRGAREQEEVLVVDVQKHVDDLVAAKVLKGCRRDAPPTVELLVDLASKDTADLASQRVVVVVGRWVGDDEECRDPAKDPPATRAGVPDSDAAEDHGQDDDKPNYGRQGYCELHTGQTARGPKDSQLAPI